MSSADAIVPTMSSTVKPKRGLASFKTMFSSKRHSIAQIPNSDESMSSSESALDSLVPSEPVTTTSSPSKSQSSVTSLFSTNQKKAMEKAIEKEAKQAIQLSTVDEQGAFLPPVPLEKGYKDNFKDNDEDFFMTIINTPPEKVRTFLSAASTISPGMFSQPSNKIKRHTMPTFPSSSEYMDVDLSSSFTPKVPSKDNFNGPVRSAKSNQVQVITYTTSAEDLTEALSESIGSLLTSSGPTSPTQEVPDLMDDSSSDTSSSPSSSPRHSTASFEAHAHHRKHSAKHELLTESIFGGSLPL
ncbi:hypothetical protein BGZ76_008822 [Entomortierella beljakovae]|nr:hypothetical protein BGZ76_008822 [Entomortierella beljakovae]